MTQSTNDLFQKLKKHTDLGHELRNEAFLRQVHLVCTQPGTSPTQASGKAKSKLPLADAFSLYRFASNPHVSIADLRRIRAQLVLDGLAPGSELLTIHDISLLDYSRHNKKRDRRKIGDGRGMGYEYTVCLAVDLAKETVLGVVHDTLMTAAGPDDQGVMNYDYEPLFADFDEQEKHRLFENHRHQMAVHINGTAELLSPYSTVDVGDREFDDVFILDRCRSHNRHFVIRSMANRNVQIPFYDWIPEHARTKRQAGHPLIEGHCCVNFQRLVEHVPLKPYKSIPLDGKGRSTDTLNAKRFASLSLGAFTMLLYRDVKRNDRYVRPPQPLTVNCVVIRECEPPPNTDPILWVLVTSLPIDTPEQIARIARIYELRWPIEVFFRLLKTGYGIEKSLFDNANKLARYLVILTIASTFVINLKESIGLPRGGYLSDQDYQKVKQALLSPNDPKIDLKLRTYAFIAKNGGWLARRRDPIGPTILMRGLLQFLAMLDAYCQYQELLEELKNHPDLVRELFGFTFQKE